MPSLSMDVSHGSAPLKRPRQVTAVKAHVKRRPAAAAPAAAPAEAVAEGVHVPGGVEPAALADDPAEGDME